MSGTKMESMYASWQDKNWLEEEKNIGVYHHMMHVIFEAIVVGIITALALVSAFTIVHPQTPTQLLATGFIIGVLIHLGFEIAGGNAWYCKYGSACSK